MTIGDQASRELITLGGLDRTLFVEAGAGTGKTTQLVGRIKNLVLVNEVPLASIAAITFTEAAAAELQDRIRVAFERTEADPATDEHTKALCRAAITDSDLAAITTLHGFARRILAEHPLAAGLPPRIAISDEVNSELAREARWERFVDSLYSDEANEALLVRAALVGAALEPRYRGHATMKDVAVELGQSWDRLDEVAAFDPGPLAPLDFRAFDHAAEACAALPDRCSDPTDKLFCHLQETVLPAMRSVAAISDPDRKLRALAKIEFKVGSGGRKDAWGDDVVGAKDVIRALNAARDEVVATASNDVLARLLVLVSVEVRDAARERQREGLLEFHDLLVLARNLLRTSSSSRQALHDRYRYLLLDEFQDTDPIQIELAVLIATSMLGDDAPTWRTAPVDPGRLFFVGDPKQSIYRFRRADIALFLEARDVFGPDDTVLRLVTNFRTVPDVLQWVNALFDQLMAEEQPGRQPRYEALLADRAPSDTGDHRPVLLGQPHEKAKAQELREHEAYDVARTIHHIRSCPDAWPVFDADSGAWRDARLADVTILVPTRTSLPILRDALAALEIPYRLDTGTLVYDTQEVRDALSALAAIDDPTDELSLVAALRSPLYACSDTDLFTYRAAGGWWDISSPTPEDIAADHPVVSALAHLRSLWAQRWWNGPSSLLDRLLEERRAFVLAFGQGRPEEVWGRLRFLVDQARSFEEAGGGDLRAFLDWAELQRSESARVHEPLLPEIGEQAVRIMTVHGAKGLEFPIAILSGMTTKPGGKRSGVSVFWDEDATRPEVKLRKGTATANHDPRADLEAEMDVHEKMRLLYVACTRARDHLVVACHHKEDDRSYAGIVWRTMQDRTEQWRRLPDATASEGPVRASQPPLTFPDASDDRDAWIDAREALLDPQRRSRFVSATTIAAELGQPPTDGDDDLDDDSDRAEAADDATVPVRRRGRAGTAIGRAVHATLQLLDLADPVDIDAQAARQAALEAVPELAETVATMVRAALGAETLQDAARRPHHKELYVAAPVGERVIEGYVDLLVETDEGLVIVDYKTDTVRSEAEIDQKLATYELQGAAYAVALEESTGLTVHDCRFVFCRPQGAVERAVSDLPDAKQRVRAHLA